MLKEKIRCGNRTGAGRKRLEVVPDEQLRTPAGEYVTEIERACKVHSHHRGHPQVELYANTGGRDPVRIEARIFVTRRLASVEERLKELARNRFPFLSQMLGHVYEPAGKRLRPAITLLASNFHPHDGANVEIMATAVELLHIASLIHDDTVDASDFRRGKATISSLWGRN
ncbi:MAG: polyprenyl synthetase family protein, partial [Candidatus Krumholzibacteriota bacterium]|nr:polyprenyl synthetase family protein [Candidatus Krumholzibacteriota bacterium]